MTEADPTPELPDETSLEKVRFAARLQALQWVFVSCLCSPTRNESAVIVFVL
jgi:hypothetical protein